METDALSGRVCDDVDQPHQVPTHHGSERVRMRERLPADAPVTDLVDRAELGIDCAAVITDRRPDENATVIRWGLRQMLYRYPSPCWHAASAHSGWPPSPRKSDRLGTHTAHPRRHMPLRQCLAGTRDSHGLRPDRVLAATGRAGRAASLEHVGRGRHPTRGSDGSESGAELQPGSTPPRRKPWGAHRHQTLPLRLRTGTLALGPRGAPVRRRDPNLDSHVGDGLRGSVG